MLSKGLAPDLEAWPAQPLISPASTCMSCAAEPPPHIFVFRSHLFSPACLRFQWCASLECHLELTVVPLPHLQSAEMTGMGPPHPANDQSCSDCWKSISGSSSHQQNISAHLPEMYLKPRPFPAGEPSHLLITPVSCITTPPFHATFCWFCRGSLSFILGCSALSHCWAVAPVSAFRPAACCVPQACSVVPGSPHLPSTHLTGFCNDVMKKDTEGLRQSPWLLLLDLSKPKF